jgi:hypothetical protein
MYVPALSLANIALLGLVKSESFLRNPSGSFTSLWMQFTAKLEYSELKVSVYFAFSYG